MAGILLWELQVHGMIHHFHDGERIANFMSNLCGEESQGREFSRLQVPPPFGQFHG